MYKPTATDVNSPKYAGQQPGHPSGTQTYQPTALADIINMTHLQREQVA